MSSEIVKNIHPSLYVLKKGGEETTDERRLTQIKNLFSIKSWYTNQHLRSSKFVNGLSLFQKIQYCLISGKVFSKSISTSVQLENKYFINLLKTLFCSTFFNFKMVKCCKNKSLIIVQIEDFSLKLKCSQNFETLINSDKQAEFNKILKTISVNLC